MLFSRYGIPPTQNKTILRIPVIGALKASFRPSLR
jgi:hypothetical protein